LEGRLRSHDDAGSGGLDLPSGVRGAIAERTMISHEHRCIFIHIPKTGGSSIEDVIWPGERTEADLWMGFVSSYCNKYQTGGLQHLLARQIRQEVGVEIFDSYFKFTFVRNPWDKAVSQFASMRDRRDLRELIDMASYASFSEYLPLTERYPHVQWERQVEFLRDENRASLVDFVGRFESLEHDARVVFERLGIRCARLPHRNRSKHRHYHRYFDHQSREWIRSRYKEDVEEFGYEFD
jgi:Sulfotransferase family